MSDREYYARRALAERAMSEGCANPRAAAVHAELADRYEAAAAKAEAKPKAKRPTLRIPSGVQWGG